MPETSTIWGMVRFRHGKPGSANLGRYQYTGQKWIAEANAYDYHARDYLPHLGIFAQTDPAGPVDGPNLYAYVLDDPVNAVDPSGLQSCGGNDCGKPIPVSACRDTNAIAIPDPSSPTGIDCISPTNTKSENQIAQNGGRAIGHGTVGGPTIAPPQPNSPESKRNQCQLEALAAGALSVALDSAGLLPGEKAAAVIIKAIATSVQGARALLGNHALAGALTAGDFGLNLAEQGIVSKSDVAKAIVGSIPLLDAAVVAVSVGNDVLETVKAYKKCSAQ